MLNQRIMSNSGKDVTTMSHKNPLVQLYAITMELISPQSKRGFVPRMVKGTDNNTNHNDELYKWKRI